MKARTILFVGVAVLVFAAASSGCEFLGASLLDATWVNSLQQDLGTVSTDVQSLSDTVQAGLAAPGTPGAAGATGPQGAAGATGPAGASGANGATGPGGTAGASGATGPAGASGAAGATGATGVGTNGTNGTDGTDGTNGTPGADATGGPIATAVVLLTGLGTGGSPCGGYELYVPGVIDWDATDTPPCGHSSLGRYDFVVTVPNQGYAALAAGMFDYPVVVTITQPSSATGAPFSAVAWPRDLTPDWHLKISVYVYDKTDLLVDGSFSIAVYDWVGG